MSIAYVLPTRDRSTTLARTLRALGSLPPHDAEVVVVDNDSAVPAVAPAHLENGMPTRVIRMDTNAGAAARNAGARAANAEWIVMLDDDSRPTNTNHVDLLRAAPSGVLAVTADIHLTRGVRESGGLPEVPVGCGVAYRRDAFLDLGGYDAAFGYYAEEYDLAARILLAGGRVAFDRRFTVEHDKAQAGRDMDRILARLIRNNGWVMQRYAPSGERRARLRADRRRYRAIARCEHAVAGFTEGLLELRATRAMQPRSPLPPALWDRFTGLAHARAAIARALEHAHFGSAAVVAEGKNAWAVRRALVEAGVRLVGARGAATLVVGTLSPGPMLDAAQQLGEGSRRVIMPWCPEPIDTRGATRPARTASTGAAGLAA